jgi:hypothetical protein
MQSLLTHICKGADWPATFTLSTPYVMSGEHMWACSLGFPGLLSVQAGQLCSCKFLPWFLCHASTSERSLEASLSVGSSLHILCVYWRLSKKLQAEQFKQLWWLFRAGYSMSKPLHQNEILRLWLHTGRRFACLELAVGPVGWDWCLGGLWTVGSRNML